METDSDISVLIVDDNAANLLTYEGLLGDLPVDLGSHGDAMVPVPGTSHGGATALLLRESPGSGDLEGRRAEPESGATRGR